jgi:hypothetical protein
LLCRSIVYFVLVHLNGPYKASIVYSVILSASNIKKNAHGGDDVKQVVVRKYADIKKLAFDHNCLIDDYVKQLREEKRSLQI